METAVAEQVAVAVDNLVQGQEVHLSGLEGEELRLMGTARRLAALPSLLGPAGLALEERLASQLRGAAGAALRQGANEPAAHRRRFRLGWAVAVAALFLLAAALLTPLGRTAVAGFLSVFDLGRTQVRITPADDSILTAELHGTAVGQRLTPEAVEAQVPFALMQPAYLPRGYALREMLGYTYPDLPPWVPQPFSVELAFDDGRGHAFSLRLYPITLGVGDQTRISAIDLEARPIQDVKQVDINGRQGVLLVLGASGGETTWREVVWEQDHLMLALSAGDLSEAELVRIARSVQ